MSGATESTHMILHTFSVHTHSALCVCVGILKAILRTANESLYFNNSDLQLANKRIEMIIKIRRLLLLLCL